MTAEQQIKVEQKRIHEKAMAEKSPLKLIQAIRKQAEAATGSGEAFHVAHSTVPKLCDALEEAVNYISVGGHFPNNKCGCAECERLNKVLARIAEKLGGE